jgi:hypothetical protein
MHDLAEELGIPIYAAHGIMEMLWHYAGDYAMNGDIGKLPDVQIARGVGWGGDPGALIEALVKVHWIDRHPVYRLIIHDWNHHAQEWVKKKLSRAEKHLGYTFLPCYVNDDMSRHRLDTVSTPSIHKAPVSEDPSSRLDTVSTPSRLTIPPRVKGSIGEYRSSGSFDSEKEKAVAPAFSRNGNNAKRWDLDEQFGVLRAGFDDAGVATIDADWADAYFVWPNLDFEQKLAAIDGIRKLKGQDPDFIKRPRKYLETSEWLRIKVKAERVKPFVDPLPTTEEVLAREKAAEPEEARQRAERRAKREAEKLAKGEKVETLEEIEERLRRRMPGISAKSKETNT